MIDVMVEQLYLSDEFEKYNIRMIENVLLLEKLPKNDQRYKALEDIYVSVMIQILQYWRICLKPLM